ncbi:MAG: SDR family NAD(P)-dependent oxidoreductase [Thermoleophilaceae bacterium]
MNLELEGKRVLVGGASRGIGLAIAKGFAAEGARVALLGRDEAALEGARAEVGASAAIPADLRSEVQTREAVHTAAEALGGLDVAVANAGRGKGPTGDAVGSDAWRDMLDENLMTAVHLCEAAQEAMSGGGALVLIGSIAGLDFHRSPLPYGSAKAALVRYSRDLARRLGPSGIRVNLVAPGNVIFPGGRWEELLSEDREGVEAMIEHEVPMKRFGTPEEIADAVLFLASERSSFTTGAVLVADGGEYRA